MTEKEFLEGFIDYGIALGYASSYNQREFINKWLEYHHQIYYELEFILKLESILKDETGTGTLNRKESDIQKDIVNFIRLLDKRVTILEDICSQNKD